ncbi:hypothetical protein PG987_007060 [Apiospora arundinis]
MALIIVLGLTCAYVAWTLFCLETNLRKARLLGVPVVRTPFNVNSHLWVVVQPLVWKLLAWFRIPWSSYPDIVRFSHRNWHFLEKSDPITRFGPVWALVCPGGIHLHFADPEVIEDIFSRWRDFVRPVHKYQVLSIFGPSLFNAPIDEWPRHRKAVAAPFNEPTMKFVWSETLRQSQSMVSYWVGHSAKGIPDLQRDTRTVTLNVLASTAFREKYDFIGSADLRKEDLSTARSFRDALLLVHKYIVHLMVIPYQYLLRPIMPKPLSRIGHAAKCLRDIMAEVVAQEKTALDGGDPGSGGLITSLVRAIDHMSKRGVLSLDETLGNVFMINFAGLDTTANVMAFMLMRLAGEPDLQDWLCDEILVISDGRPAQDWEYELFPRFKRCYAVLLETLRLYAPVTSLPKMTTTGQTVQVDGRSIAIPAGTDVFPMLLGIQTDPRYWTDPFAWKPSRWIERPVGCTSFADEQLVDPPKRGVFPLVRGAPKLSWEEVVAD